MGIVGHRAITATPLTAEAFARFGSVVEHRGGERRSFVGGAFETSASGRKAAFWVSRTGPAAVWPVVVRRLERHPHAAQTFVPLDGVPYLTFLCDTFDMLYREGRTDPKMMSVGLHLRIAGYPGRAAAVERFLDHVRGHEGA